MAYNVLINRKVKKYIKKLKDKKLKITILNAIYDEIAINPYEVGDIKNDDLSNFFAYKLRYKGTQYRIAYTIDEDGRLVIIALVGTRENFYGELKKLLIPNLNI